jgi:hypothetical protein
MGLPRGKLLLAEQEHEIKSESSGSDQLNQGGQINLNFSKARYPHFASQEPITGSDLWVSRLSSYGYLYYYPAELKNGWMLQNEKAA